MFGFINPILSKVKTAILTALRGERKLSIMLTDPGNAIPDDEMLLQVIMSTSRDTDWLVVCVPGDASLDPQDATKESIKRQQTLCDYFPDKFTAVGSTWSTNDCANVTWFNWLNSTYKIGDISLLTEVKKNVEYLLHIAPLRHEPADKYLNHLEVDTLVVMGDLENPHQSTNLLKSTLHHPWITCADTSQDEYWTKHLTEQYHEQQQTLASICNQTVDIPSSFARDVRLPNGFCKQLPASLLGPVLTMSFKQLVTRADVNSPRGIEILKSDHQRILSCLTPTQSSDIIDYDGVNILQMEITHEIYKQVDKFLDNSEISDDDDALKKRYRDIAMAVYLITQSPYKPVDSSDNVVPVFSVDNLVDMDMAYQNWREFVDQHRLDLVPSYDVLVYVVMQYGYLPTADICRRAMLLGDLPHFI